jgi:AraC-like DNA-binding protein
MAVDSLTLAPSLPLRALNGGLFVSRGQGIHPRRTLSSFELIFVAQGCLEMLEENRTFSLPAGHALLLWPGRWHAGAAPYPPELAFYWVHFELLDAPVAHGPGALVVPQIGPIARPERLTELFRRFLGDQESGAFTPFEASHLLALMLHELTRTPPLQPAPEERGAVLARHVRQYLLTHLDTPLTTTRIARALDGHPDYLGRCFRAVYGETITEAIHRERLKRARALLLDTTDPIDTIARGCGFPGVVFFRRVFKRHAGVPPSVFRKRYARVHVNTD